MALNFSTSIEDQFKATGYRPSGFDYMRLTLAVAVIFNHTFQTAYGNGALDVIMKSPAGAGFRLILPMFFALSGFLVAGSLERCKTLVTFLGLRVIRIYPALICEVILSAFLIGPFITTVPLTQYFTDEKFFHYLLNATGHPSFYLPGVFEHNPNPGKVNGQLWTVPYELFCYLAISGLFLLGIKKRKWIAPAAVIGGLAIIVGYRLFAHHTQMEYGPVRLGLVFYFLAGVGAYLYRDRIVWSPVAFWFALAMSLLLLGFVPLGGYLATPFVAYVTVYLGVCDPKRVWVIGLADISYGIYLYGSVIMQLIAFLFPAAREWYWILLLTLPVSCAVGLASWYGVEKPALQAKKFLKPMEEKLLSLRKPKPLKIAAE